MKTATRTIVISGRRRPTWYEPHHKVWRERDRCGCHAPPKRANVHGAIASRETAWSLL